MDKIRSGVYQHFKGTQYVVLGEVTHSETQEVLVLYAPLYEKFQMFVRPKAMFLEKLDRPEGYKGPRFQYIREAP